MRDDPIVVALVTRVRGGDRDAWNELVERYAPLVWGICLRHRLSRVEADDVGQTVWLKLIEQLATIREPAALPGWLATTTNRECLRVLRTARADERAERTVAPEIATDGGFDAVEEELERAEVQLALREAFEQLPPHCQALLSLLFHDPPLSYRDIARRLDMQVSAVGPGRGRCLKKLRQCPALAWLIEAELPSGSGGETYDQPMVDR
jgi:RNA polymerase sigma factor (sigma-70 family)